MAKQDDIQLLEDGSLELKSVYVMSAARKIKIGVAKDPHKRMRAIQASIPWTVSLEAVWDVPACRAFKVEKWAHTYLDRYRQGGEWFRCDLHTVRLFETQLFTIAYGHNAFQDECDSDSSANQFAHSIMQQRRWMTLDEQGHFRWLVARENMTQNDPHPLFPDRPRKKSAG